MTISKMVSECRAALLKEFGSEITLVCKHCGVETISYERAPVDEFTDWCGMCEKLSDECLSIADEVKADPSKLHYKFSDVGHLDQSIAPEHAKQLDDLLASAGEPSKLVKAKAPKRASFAVFIAPSGLMVFEISAKHDAIHAVGGKADGDETPFETLRREVYEEINCWITLEQVSEVRNSTIVYGDDKWEEHYFVIPVSEGEVHGMAKERAGFVARSAWMAVTHATLTCAGRQAAMIGIESL